jgi:hypothetical protein
MDSSVTEPKTDDEVILLLRLDETYSVIKIVEEEELKGY